MPGAAMRMRGALPRCSTHTGAYGRARQRLPVEMTRALARFSGQRVAQRTPMPWRWRGRAVRLVGMVCTGSGAILEAATGRYQGKGGDEQSLLRSILHSLQRGDVLLGDAYYATCFLLCTLLERGVDAVFEQHGSRRRSTDFRCGQRLGERDHLIVLHKPDKPDWMSPVMAIKEIWVYLLAYNLIRLSLTPFHREGGDVQLHGSPITDHESRGQGFMMSLPITLPDSNTRCARAASASGMRS